MKTIYEWNQPDSETGEDTISVVVRMTASEMGDLISRYDPGVGTSPGVSDARPVLRAILDAVIEHLSQQP